MNVLIRIAVISLTITLAGVLIMACLDLASPAVQLSKQVAEHMAKSGVEHPVTAVLLNFRGYDTLLEVMVLFVAFIGILAVTRTAPGHAAETAPDAVLVTLARLLTPLIVLTAGYLLWAGAYRPGGAFQAAALLAAAAVLLHLARLLPAWDTPRLPLRLGLAGGGLLFLGVATLLIAEGALLTYPVANAGKLILFIESGLTVSLGLILAGLFLVSSGERSR